VLGATSKGEGYLHGNGYVVTWAIGHLAALAQPHEINPTWRQWRRDYLPILPTQWPLVVCEKTKDQSEAVRKIVNSPRSSEVVWAADAGREGEFPGDREWKSSAIESMRWGLISPSVAVRHKFLALTNRITARVCLAAKRAYPHFVACR
jgi:hypothetical protein